MSEVRARPLVIAHRGASGREPEHTEAAYRRALDDGADGFECDVRLTRDRVLVCLHDRTVERTSNGRGVVSRMTLAKLEQLNFAARKSKVPAKILTFDALLDLAKAAGRPLMLTVETKHPNRHAGEVERRLVATLAEHGLTEPDGRDGVTVRVMSFSPAAVRSVSRLAPDVPTVALMSRLPNGAGARPLFGGARIAGPSLAAVKADPEYVARAHERGDEVYVWTVDDPEDVLLLARLGVDAIITNRPDVARAALA